MFTTGASTTVLASTKSALVASPHRALEVTQSGRVTTAAPASRNSGSEPSSEGPSTTTSKPKLRSTGTALTSTMGAPVMVRTGKAYQNLMVDVQQTNEKLHTRAENIVIDATGVEREKARAAIDAAGGSVKTAITMLLADCDAAEAARRLERARGHVRSYGKM